MSRPAQNILLLGCCGGVARGLLGILERALDTPADPFHQWLRTARIHGVDPAPPPDFLENYGPALRERLTLTAGAADDENDILDRLRSTNSGLLVDLTGGDCRAAILACERAGARYLNSAIEITGPMQCEPVRILEEIEIFQAFRKERRLTGIVGAGMNPGVVQWLALDLIKRAGDEIPRACYVVENDTTFFADPTRAQADRVYTTWSPEGFLYEAFHSRPIFMRGSRPVAIWDRVYSQEFLVRLGEESFYGHLMAHEEVLNLGRLFDMETAFLYRVNDHSCRVLERTTAGPGTPVEPDCESLRPGQDYELAGADLVGVLLVYPDREVYAYNRLATDEVYERYGVNATYYQVACGTAAALACLLFDEPGPGLFYVDELLLDTPARFGEYLRAYLKDFQYGRNDRVDGLLFDRMRPTRS